MTHDLVPVPYQELERTRNIWGPYVLEIAQRQRCFLEQRLAEVYAGDIAILLIVEREKQQHRGLVGYRVVRRGKDTIGRVEWVTGEGAQEWKHLHDLLKAFFQKMGCAGMDAEVRPGWSKDMKAWGYKLTHMRYELDFINGNERINQ